VMKGSGVVGDEGFVGLAEAIGAVRGELVAAQFEGTETPDGGVVRFAVEQVELEFIGELKHVVGGGGGVKFWVVSADAKGERSSTSGHKVKVVLRPKTADGESFKVAGGVVAPPLE
jgi:hypothetical protein